jgi:hypothetical protein
MTDAPLSNYTCLLFGKNGNVAHLQAFFLCSESDAIANTRLLATGTSWSGRIAARPKSIKPIDVIN